MFQNTTESPGHTTAKASALEQGRRELLVFRVGDCHFGIDIKKLQELRHYGSLTRIANGSRLIEGVVSLSGRVMPMIDLRPHLSSAVPLYDETTDVIVMRVGGRPVCVVVDSVLDVAVVYADQLQPISHAAMSASMDCLIGTAEWESKRLLLLDIDKVLLDPANGNHHRMAA